MVPYRRYGSPDSTGVTFIKGSDEPVVEAWQKTSGDSMRSGAYGGFDEIGYITQHES